MAAASASNHKAEHHKAKTVSKGGSNPTSSICTDIASAQSSSGNLGAALGKVITDGGLSNFATAKQEMITAINNSLKEEGPAENALHSAPANVQAAMKGLFSFASTLKTDISNASTPAQLASSMSTLGQDTGVRADSLTLANYVTSLCGTTTTTS